MPAISTHCGRSSSQAMNSGLGFRSHALVRREQRSENPEAAVLPFVGFRPLNWRFTLEVVGAPSHLAQSTEPHLLGHTALPRSNDRSMLALRQPPAQEPLFKVYHDLLRT
jgi:hypothetical protein